MWCIGRKPTIDATPWVITEVAPNLTEAIYTTALQLETRQEKNCSQFFLVMPYTMKEIIFE